METLHTVDNREKVEQIKANLERDGWVGAPLVVDGDQLLTGTHRYTAAKELDWVDYDIPMIEISDLFAEHGLDWNAIMDDEDYDLVSALAYLPEDIRNEYGIDIH